MTIADSLVSRHQELARLRAVLATHLKDAEEKTVQIKRQIANQQTLVNQFVAGIDPDIVNLAKTVVYIRGIYANAGEGKAGCKADAIAYFAGTLAEKWKNLRQGYFGTKDYSGWHGQREDHPYGYGPRHGSTIFEIGLVKEARERDLTDAERDAAIYLLMNLEAIQACQAAA